jgi:hypothetical protein
MGTSMHVQRVPTNIALLVKWEQKGSIQGLVSNRGFDPLPAYHFPSRNDSSGMVDETSPENFALIVAHDEKTLLRLVAAARSGSFCR